MSKQQFSTPCWRDANQDVVSQDVGLVLSTRIEKVNIVGVFFEIRNFIRNYFLWLVRGLLMYEYYYYFEYTKS